MMLTVSEPENRVKFNLIDIPQDTLIGFQCMSMEQARNLNYSRDQSSPTKDWSAVQLQCSLKDALLDLPNQWQKGLESTNMVSLTSRKPLKVFVYSNSEEYLDSYSQIQSIRDAYQSTIAQEQKQHSSSSLPLGPLMNAFGEIECILCILDFQKMKIMIPYQLFNDINFKPEVLLTFHQSPTSPGTLGNVEGYSDLTLSELEDLGKLYAKLEKSIQVTHCEQLTQQILFSLNLPQVNHREDITTQEINSLKQRSNFSGTTWIKSDSKMSLTDRDENVYDPRHPLYLGDWKRSVPGIHEDIAKDDLDEPHIKRKHAILEKHPEIKELYGYEPSTKWITMFLAAIQLISAYVFGNILTDWHWTMFITCYLIGAPISQVFGVIIHEATHCLCGEGLMMNRAVGLIANIGIPFPIAMSFRRYHLEHHSFQGVIGKDPDLPLDWEVKLIKGNPFTKFLFLFFYPMMYVVRGAAQQKKPTKWEIINWIFTISTDYLVYHFCGFRGLFYLFICLWFGYGIHPAAAHFIQEHYTFDDGQETYSYYGSLNKLFMNIGYHNEHHDFTKVAWSKLPAVREIAPEFYNTIACHMSWWKVLYDFVMDKQIGPQSRVGRDHEDHKKGRRMIVQKKILKVL